MIVESVAVDAEYAEGAVVFEDSEDVLQGACDAKAPASVVGRDWVGEDVVEGTKNAEAAVAADVESAEADNLEIYCLGIDFGLYEFVSAVTSFRNLASLFCLLVLLTASSSSFLLLPALPLSSLSSSSSFKNLTFFSLLVPLFSLWPAFSFLLFFLTCSMLSSSFALGEGETVLWLWTQSLLHNCFGRLNQLIVK